MRKDVTTFTRYLLLLILVFVAWLLLLYKFSKDSNFATFFGKNDDSLIILHTFEK